MAELAAHFPAVKDLIMLDVPVAVILSPWGEKVAVLVRRTDWKDNLYETVCQVHDLSNHVSSSLTRSGSVLSAEWIGEQTLAVLKQESQAESKAQVWLYENLTGDGWQVTDHKTGVEWFKPFADGILFKARNPEREENQERQDAYGKFTHFEQEASPSALYYLDLVELRRQKAHARSLTEAEAKKLTSPLVELSRLLPEPLSIQEVTPSPTGDAIYLTCWPHDDLVYMKETQIFCLQLDAAAAVQEQMRRAQEQQERQSPSTVDTPAEDLSYLGRITRLPLPPQARSAGVSPDGRQLLLFYPGSQARMYTYAHLWVIDTDAARQAADQQAAQGAMKDISSGFDEEILEVYWVAAGIFGLCVQGTAMRVVRLDGLGGFELLDLGDRYPFYTFHVSQAGQVGMPGTNQASFPEACIAWPGTGSAWQVERLSEFGQAVAGWELGTVETIRWISRDGTEIEGVLRKPASFDPSRRYPLVFVVHGGPSWFSPAYLLANDDLRYYPSVQWAGQNVLVLKPNYRGSIGRGQAFAELNVNNLGVGDLWDLESAIDHLVARGWVDEQRVGCMGWSQGGYISAFAGLRSERFKAVSVGAGISDWYTYHISNDIPDFTNDYLSVSPFRARQIYDLTAPMSGLRQARTPMLIQHGSDDRRVPLSNAMELYRGLKEMGVPVELYIYPGMAHPITKPRENHAVMQQNLAWFNHYLLDEPLQLP